jgi:hypothetical protein
LGQLHDQRMVILGACLIKWAILGEEASPEAGAVEAEVEA